MNCSIQTFVRILVVTFLLFSCAPAWAATGGSISGTITDEKGGVIPGATVTIRNLDTTVAQTTTSNGEGFYAFTNVPVGRYELEIIDPRIQTV